MRRGSFYNDERREFLSEMLKVESDTDSSILIIKPMRLTKLFKSAYDIDGLARHQPSHSEASCVGVRNLSRKEIKKLEKGKPPIQQTADDIKRSFRPCDTIYTNHDAFGVTTTHGRLGVTSSPPPERDGTEGSATDIPFLPILEFNYDDDVTGDSRELKFNVATNTNSTTTATHRSSKKRQSSIYPALRALPIHAISVKWKLNCRSRCYTLTMVKTLLSEYGEIVFLSRVSQNSALVEFNRVKSSWKAIRGNNSCYVKGRDLICDWWFPNMRSYANRIFEEKVHDVPRRGSFRENRVSLPKVDPILAASIRARTAQMSHDASTFVK